MPDEHPTTFNQSIINRDIPIDVWSITGSTVRHSEPLDAIYVPTLGQRSELASRLRTIGQFTRRIILLCSFDRPSWLNFECFDNTPVVMTDLATSTHYKSFLKKASSQNPSLLVRKDYDLPFKRNLAISHARVAGFQYIALLDDDIELDIGSFGEAVHLLRRGADFVGCHVLEFPDVSAIDHVERYILRRPSPVSLGANCLLFDVGKVNSFFPYIYNEDWLFILSHIGLCRIASAGFARQDAHRPWEDQVRVRFEQFGEIIIAGAKLNIAGKRHYLSGSARFWEDVKEEYIRRLKCLLHAPLRYGPFLSAVDTALAEVATIRTSDIIAFVENYKRELAEQYI